MPFHRTRPAGTDDVIVVRAMFQVRRFAIPPRALSEIEQAVWSQADELRIAPDDYALIQQNGLRLGTIPSSAQAPIAELIASQGGKGESLQKLVTPGAPLTLDFGVTGDYQTVFVFGRDGKLVGNTIGGASKLLHVDYESAIVGGRPEFKLRITPELFKQADRPQWQIDDGRIEYRKRYVGAAFRQLAATIKLKQGESLIIGPSGEGADKLSVGGTVLTDESDGRSWTTVLLITPQLFRTGNGTTR